MSDGNDFNERNIAEFRANHGRVGGGFEGAPLVLLHTVGARSGKPRTNIMMYLADGDRYLVFASNAGADDNPAWYWNLKANPNARIEVGDDIVDVHATELQGAERDDKYALQAERYPGFAEYQRKTSRTIPVVALTAYQWGEAARMKVLRTTPPASPGGEYAGVHVGAQLHSRKRRTEYYVAVSAGRRSLTDGSAWSAKRITSVPFTIVPTDRRRTLAARPRDCIFPSCVWGGAQLAVERVRAAVRPHFRCVASRRLPRSPID